MFRYHYDNFELKMTQTEKKEKKPALRRPLSFSPNSGRNNKHLLHTLARVYGERKTFTYWGVKIYTDEKCVGMETIVVVFLIF